MILITGGSGYIGSHVVRRLTELGKPIRAMIRNPEKAKREGRLSGLEVQWVDGDVTVPSSLPPALQGISAVIHTVAIAIEKGERTYEAINFEGTVNLVNAVRNAGISRFIHLSQLGADPSLPYRFLASKGKAQQYIIGSDLAWTVFRPSVVWGPEDEFANSFARLAPLTPLIFPIIGGENAIFQPVWVEDVVTAVVKALDDDKAVRAAYELGGPEILSLEEIERRTLAAIGARRIFVHFPMPLLRLLATLMELFLPSPPVTRSLLELLAVSNVTQDNGLGIFVSNPRPFTVGNISPYMRAFRVRDTIAQFMSK
jgi:uncharacterized protein YbjT (DUF2867 family)